MTTRETRAGSASTRSAGTARPAGSGDRGPSERPGGEPPAAGARDNQPGPRPATRCPTCGHWTVPRPVCVCGHGWNTHAIHTKRAACSADTCGCTEFREATA